MGLWINFILIHSNQQAFPSLNSSLRGYRWLTAWRSGFSAEFCQRTSPPRRECGVETEGSGGGRLFPGVSSNWAGSVLASLRCGDIIPDCLPVEGNSRAEVSALSGLGSFVTDQLSASHTDFSLRCSLTGLSPVDMDLHSCLSLPPPSPPPFLYLYFPFFNLPSTFLFLLFSPLLSAE